VPWRHYFFAGSQREDMPIISVDSEAAAWFLIRSVGRVNTMKKSDLTDISEKMVKSDIRVRLLTVEELARQLQVPRSWIYQHTRLGTIPCVRIGKYVRFDHQEVITFFRGKNNTPKREQYKYNKATC